MDAAKDDLGEVGGTGTKDVIGQRREAAGQDWVVVGDAAVELSAGQVRHSIENPVVNGNQLSAFVFQQSGHQGKLTFPAPGR